MLTVGVLLYGDYPQLADRCLRSITRTFRAEDLRLRIAMNQVSQEVSDWVRSWAPDSCVWEFSENIGKYPAMRAMLYDKPVRTPFFMWFDDDSYLEGYELRTGRDYWPDKVINAMADADMIGSIYHMGFYPKQLEWIRKQPWYAGKDPETREELNKKAKFATGGWWTIRTELLYKYNYPWPELHHNGGDSMLGELFYQQDLRLKPFKDGVRINADAKGRESKAARRGISEKPIGAS